MKERWKSIKGYEGLYEISDQGRVKSLSRFIKTHRSYISKEKILKNRNTGDGYYKIQLCKNNKKEHRIPRLVAEAFVPNPENKKEVNHKDGNTNNDFYKNLEWVTPKENMQHAIKTGLIKIGENSLKSKLTNKQVIQIKKEILKEKSNLKISKKYNVNRQTIYDIRIGKNWSMIK